MEITHRGLNQVVTPEHLRHVLEAQGEQCFCAPPDLSPETEWDPGYCPEHREWCRSHGIGDYWHPRSGVPHPDA
jgi:hypothetical protein